MSRRRSSTATSCLACAGSLSLKPVADLARDPHRLHRRGHPGRPPARQGHPRRRPGTHRLAAVHGLQVRADARTRRARTTSRSRTAPSPTARRCRSATCASSSTTGTGSSPSKTGSRSCTRRRPTAAGVQRITRTTPTQPQTPRQIATAIKQYGMVGHSQATAQAREHGRPLIIRRDFNTTDGDYAGLHFVSVQRSIEDFVVTRKRDERLRRPQHQQEDHRHQEQRHQRLHQGPAASELHHAVAGGPVVPVAAWSSRRPLAAPYRSSGVFDQDVS